MDKNLFRDVSYGMYIVTTSFEGVKSGCTINTFTQITSENPIITISVNKENYTDEMIKKSKRFAVNVLSEKTNSELIGRFGFHSSRDFDKFNDTSYEEIENVPVLKEDTCGYFICELLEVIDCETHDIFKARVKACAKLTDNEPMTYKYYHDVIKGTAPKSAPTYIEEKKSSTSYVCSVCGYVYEGELPDDFKCPICGVGKEMFTKKEN